MKNMVSIIIPYYKKKKFIKETLDSVYNQTYKNYEVILIYNDKNKDDFNFVKSHLKKFPRYTIIKNFKLGVGISRNLGIKISKGKFLAFLDSDDLWRKDKLKKQINYMINKNILVSHTAYKVIDEKKNFLYSRQARHLEYSDLLKSCDVGLSTVIIKKNSRFKIKFPSLKTKEDYVLWLKISKTGYKFYGLNLPLVSWRKTKNSLSSSLTQKLLDGFRVYNIYEGKSIMNSLINLLYLSINYIKKKFRL